MIDLKNFAPVKGYECSYLVSPEGEIFSVKSNKLLKPYTDKNGYKIVGLFRNGSQKKHKVHRIVAVTFLPNPHNYPQVNHIDENPANNNVTNLEWCSCEYNINFGNRNHKVSVALSNKTDKMRPVACLDMNMNLITIFQSLHSVERWGFNRGAVYSVCNRKYRHKSYKGFIWRYVDELEVGM